MPAQCCKDRWNLLLDEDPEMPVFTLLAQDELATAVIKEWIFRAQQRGVSQEKLAKVQDHLEAIEEWQSEHPERVKKPD